MKRPWHFRKRKQCQVLCRDRSCCSQSVAADKNGTYCSSADWKTYSYSHVKNVAVVSFDMGDILEKVL